MLTFLNVRALPVFCFTRLQHVSTVLFRYSSMLYTTVRALLPLLRATRLHSRIQPKYKLDGAGSPRLRRD